MDKRFWVELSENDFRIPEGHALSDLTRELFSHLASLDPELRDDVAYVVYANWLKRELYSTAEIRAHVQELLANLEKGLGEAEGDLVFLRTFSVLFLAEIVHNDNKRGFFEAADVQAIYKKGIRYLTTEKDTRGYVPVKGWAHGLAHGADLLMTLAKNRHLSAPDLTLILYAISEKVFKASERIYVCGEDERLAGAALQVLQRDMIGMKEVKQWVFTFIEQNWKDAYLDPERSNAFHNTRNLLRSLYLELKGYEGEMPKRAELEIIFLEVLKGLKPY